MGEKFKSVLFLAGMFYMILTFHSCKGMKNYDRPVPEDSDSGKFVTVRDGIKIYLYEYIPVSDFKSTIYIVSGITGINHKREKDIIELLSNNKNRVVVIHPRGTGYSEGTRGDIEEFSDFVSDYTEIIRGDRFYSDSTGKVILYGHSMSCAIALKVAAELQRTDGLILVNPPYKLKQAKGMTPGIADYIKYAGYYIFASHVPVVNMAGDPASIENEADRIEADQRGSDSLLVKYFSMRCMSASKKIMNEMVDYSKQSDFPLLLLYGENDKIADKSGCDLIFNSWKNSNKSFVIIKGGSHGKSTVSGGAEIIERWIAGIGNPAKPVIQISGE